MKPLLTHNCQWRLVAGRVGMIASRMALDGSQGTTIDSSRKGAGIVKSNGEVTHLQVYFAKQEWIQDWFTSRGLGLKGYPPGEDPDEVTVPTLEEFGEDEDLTITKDVTTMEFAGEVRSVDHTPDQRFREV